MADQQPSRTKSDKMAGEVERIIRNTPREAILDMDQRLRELRRTPEVSAADDLMHKRAGWLKTTSP